RCGHPERDGQRPEPRRHGLHVGVGRAPLPQACARARAPVREPDDASRRHRVLVASGRLVGRFPALGHRNFRRYAVGQVISLAGFWMQNVAQGWLVYRLSGSELALGVVAFVGYMPVFLVSPFAGVVADRMDKRRLIYVTQSLAMLLAFVLGLLVVN